jgi:hypothetical protein
LLTFGGINLIGDSGGSVSKIGITTEGNKMGVDDYKVMVSFLSRELHIKVEADSVWNRIW